MAEDSSGRHRKLSKYINNIVTKICPKDLSADQDDIAQTVLIRLSKKLNEIADDLEQCRRLIKDSDTQKPELVRILRRCLDEIGKSWDRKKCEAVKRKIAKCLDWAQKNEERIERTEAHGLVEDSITWLSKIEPKEIYSTVYIKRGVHWAIMDARKKSHGNPEVSLEEREREDGSCEGALPGRMSWQRCLMIREEISDCLSRLDEPKRFPTFMALIGYEYSEIAKYFQLSIPQADSRIRRGKALLRNCLKRKGVFP